MAIGITNLGESTGINEVAPDIRTLTDLTSYTIPSWDPPNDGIVVLCGSNGQNTITDIAIDSLTGNGDVWAAVDSMSFDAGRRSLWMYAAKGADLATGITTIDFGTDTQLYCYISIFQITGADESGTAVQAFGLIENQTGSGTSANRDWAGTPQDANSRPLYWVGHVANELVTHPGSLTKIDDMNGAGPALGFVSAWQSDGFTDPSDSFTWTTSVAYGILAVEIKMASAAGEPPNFETVIGGYGAM